jgi:hypothetical protein
MAFPLKWPRSDYSIAHADVVDLAGKNRLAARASQQLSDCFRSAKATGQFLAADRKAVRLNESV